MGKEKLKCIILEDEVMATNLLVDYIRKQQKLELVASFDSPVDFIAERDNLEFDLMFLDILMPEMTGIDLLKTIALDCEVIVTSASPDYALDCYPLKVADYLLKPFRLNRFINAVQRAEALIELKRNAEDNKAGIRQRTYMMVKVDKRLVKICISDILYVEAAWEYAKIFTEGRSYVVLSQIKRLEAELEACSFYRIHRSYLVNLDHIAYIEGNTLAIDNKKLPISRNYKKGLIECLK